MKLLLNSCLIVAISLCSCASDETHREFRKLKNSSEWTLDFEDSCCDDWQENWFKDGLIATVEQDKDGMNLIAGPKNGDDAHHTVLWTKQSFEGDVKIEYEYTRTDEQTINVNIIYIQAEGTGRDGYDTDITLWNHLREVPTMSTYYNNMNTLHISYAAFPMINDDPENDYIRVRKYPIDHTIDPTTIGVEPSLYKLGLFKPNVTYHVTIIKDVESLFMKVVGDGKGFLYRWDISETRHWEGGRIGLRHMFTRSARYKDFKVYTKPVDSLRLQEIIRVSDSLAMVKAGYPGYEDE